MDAQHKGPLVRSLFPLLCSAFSVLPQTGYRCGENVISQPRPWASWSYPRVPKCKEELDALD